MGNGQTSGKGLIMASNKTLVPEAKQALNQFKMEAASEVGVNLSQGYNGDLTSRQAGSIGGQMVKKMIEKYENDIKGTKLVFLYKGKDSQWGSFRIFA